LNDGEGGFSDGSEYWLANTGHGTGAAWADYDLDGDLDLYLGNWGDPNVLIVNGNTEGNHWLELELEGTVSNRSAIGTRVRAVCGGLSQIREVTGGTGYASQGAPVVHFGLGSSSLVDTLVIKWPSGSVETWRNVTADVVFKIVEGDPTGVEDWIPDQRAVSFSSCRPNPFADGTRFVYALPSACNVSACVYDVSGRLVRTLLHLTQQEAGAHVLKWNGRNDSGTRVASGVYMCRVEACGASAACKAVITR